MSEIVTKKDVVRDEPQTDKVILKKNIKSGNYSIWRKTVVNHAPSLERVRYMLYNIMLPFGCETYNNSIVLNGLLTNSSNFNHNVIFALNKISNTFTHLKDKEALSQMYNIKNKSFIAILKE